jgi:hypothetical protein
MPHTFYPQVRKTYGIHVERHAHVGWYAALPMQVGDGLPARIASARLDSYMQVPAGEEGGVNDISHRWHVVVADAAGMV